MHLLDDLELYLKRSALSDKSGISYGYLSSLVNQRTLSDEVEEKVREAVKEIIKDLEKVLKNKN
jgi:Ni,Fe-hydrogenase maturation factor